jgi:hypothetical protein
MVEAMASDVLSKRLLVLIGSFVALLLVGGAVIAFALSSGSTGSPLTASRTTTTASATKTAAPLNLSSVPADVAEHYRYAAAHLIDYRQIPCWCGCMQYLGHRSLADCFVRADGKGWEAHAALCPVCLAEATMAERMLSQGSSPHDVAEAIALQFGPTSVTAPSM